MQRFFLLVLLSLCWCTTPVWAQKQIAIIIDDIGYRASDQATLALPGPITYAILPHTPYAKRLANQAHQQNKEVMAHMPMEALENNHLLGEGAITADMDEGAVKQQLREALASIPHVRGMNNHMGSRLTQMSQPMRWTMEVLREQQLYFLDSKTIPGSTAEDTALQLGVQTNHRQIFLDNQLTEENLQRQFDKLLRIADKYHWGIAIAHPHPETVAFLQQQLPTIRARGIELVPLSQLMAATNPTPANDATTGEVAEATAAATTNPAMTATVTTPDR